MRWSILFVCMAIMMFNATVVYAKYYGQVMQDKYLNEQVFRDKKHGVFVDVGAHDGISISNTYFFESELDWHGICLEPYPEFYEKLAKNRKCVCLPVCAGKETGITKFLKIHCPKNPYVEMLSGMLNNYNAAHLKRIEISLKKYGGYSEIIDLPVRTLTDILHEHNIITVDFLSIDVEGGELDVILGLDFSQFTIRYILIENNYKNEFKPIQNILEMHGYKKIHSFDFDELFELQS